MPDNARYDRIALVASAHEEAQSAEARLVARYGDHKPDAADVVVALGGDGFMLQMLHELDGKKPIYGMHRGSVGLLMNEVADDNLHDALAQGERTAIPPSAE